MQRKKPIFIGELIKQSMNNNAVLAKGMQEADIVNSWRDIVGETMFSYTTKLYIRNQQLFVEFSSAAAKQEFYTRRHYILNEINRVAGKILIRFIYVV